MRERTGGIDKRHEDLGLIQRSMPDAVEHRSPVDVVGDIHRD